MADDLQHKLECLARHVLDWTLARRRDFLQKYEKHNGHDAAEKLKTIITTEWEKQRNAKRTENITGEPGADLAGTEPHGQAAGTAYRS